MTPKPCPFCGGTDFMAWEDNDGNVTLHHDTNSFGCTAMVWLDRDRLPDLNIDDLDDSGIIELDTPGLEPLIEMWNRRTT